MEQAAGAQRDGARGRVEVAAVRGPGQHVEAEAGGACRERRLQVGEKLVALRRQARCVAVASQAGGELDRASIPGVGPEVVPVGIRRLVGIAFVADRWRHQAEIGAALARPVRVDAFACRAATPCAQWPRPRAATAPGPFSRRGCSARARSRRTRIRRRCRSRAPGRRRATVAQQGTLPFLNWKGANQSRKSRATSSCPSRSSADDVSAPSRIHDRA